MIIITAGFVTDWNYSVYPEISKLREGRGGEYYGSFVCKDNKEAECVLMDILQGVRDKKHCVFLWLSRTVGYMLSLLRQEDNPQTEEARLKKLRDGYYASVEGNYTGTFLFMQEKEDSGET